VQFSVTERQTAKRCPRAHRLSSKGGQHLGLIVPPVYLSVGSLIHKGSQMWLLDTERTTSYEAHVTEAASNLIESSRARYLRQIGAPISEDEEAPLWEAMDYARIMARNYEIRWGTPLPEDYTLIRPEQRVVVPVPGTEHECERCGFGSPSGRGSGLEPDARGLPTDLFCSMCNGEGVQLHHLDGRFDGLIVDRGGRIHILEHKTYKSRPNIDGLKTNDQFLAYMWLAMQLDIGDVAGVAYDGLWRRDTVPRGKSFEDLFYRVTITRSLAELREFQAQLPNELNFMYNQLKAPTDPWINRRWQGCYDCPFASKTLKNGTTRTGLCDAISRGEDVKSVKTLYYTERNDDVDEAVELDTEDAAA